MPNKIIPPASFPRKGILLNSRQYRRRTGRGRMNARLGDYAATQATRLRYDLAVARLCGADFFLAVPVRLI